MILYLWQQDKNNSKMPWFSRHPLGRSVAGYMLGLLFTSCHLAMFFSCLLFLAGSGPPLAQLARISPVRVQCAFQQLSAPAWKFSGSALAGLLSSPCCPHQRLPVICMVWLSIAFMRSLPGRSVVLTCLVLCISAIRRLGAHGLPGFHSPQLFLRPCKSGNHREFHDHNYLQLLKTRRVRLKIKMRIVQFMYWAFSRYIRSGTEVYG